MALTALKEYAKAIALFKHIYAVNMLMYCYDQMIEE